MDKKKGWKHRNSKLDLKRVISWNWFIIMLQLGLTRSFSICPKLIANSRVTAILFKNDSAWKLTLINKAQLHQLRQTAHLLTLRLLL